MADRNILVTGGYKGIGRAIAAHFAALGDHVAVIDVFDVGADAVVVGDDDRAVSYAQCDVADEQAVATAVARLRADLGPFSGIVNNAGIYPRAALIDMAYDDWMHVIAVNLGGARNTVKAVMQLGDEVSTSIVNLSSPIAFHGAPRGSHYASSKAGLLGLTRALALELSPLHRVNAVMPGVTDTDQVRLGGRSDDDLAAYAAENVPLGRNCTPDDVADAVGFFVSDASKFITGQALMVNGGAYFH